MATQNTFSGLTNEQAAAFYVKTLLRRLLPMLSFNKYGRKDTVATRNGDTVNWRKFGALAAATTALTEGVTPTGQSLTVTKVEATLAQYGDFVPLTDKVDLLAIDPILVEASELLGEQAALSIDTLIRDVLKAGTNVLYGGTATARSSLAATDILTGDLVRKAARELKNANARYIDGQNYLAWIHPFVAYDLQGDDGWTNANQYAGSTNIFSGELGKLWGVRFIETTQAPVFADAGASSADVYATLFVGADAFGVPRLTGNATPQVIVHPPGDAGSSDPLNQRGSTGWKLMFAAKRLEEDAIVRVETGATA